MTAAGGAQEAHVERGIVGHNHAARGEFGHPTHRPLLGVRDDHLATGDAVDVRRAERVGESAARSNV